MLLPVRNAAKEGENQYFLGPSLNKFPILIIQVISSDLGPSIAQILKYSDNDSLKYSDKDSTTGLVLKYEMKPFRAARMKNKDMSHSRWC